MERPVHNGLGRTRLRFVLGGDIELGDAGHLERRGRGADHDDSSSSGKAWDSLVGQEPSETKARAYQTLSSHRALPVAHSDIHLDRALTGEIFFQQQIRHETNRILSESLGRVRTNHVVARAMKQASL